MMRFILIAAAFAFAACSPPTQQAAPQNVDLPEGAAEAVLAAMPGFTITDSEQQGPNAGGELEVTGTNAEGVEYELDLMPREGGGWNVVQVQRDIVWADAPENVRAVAAAAPGAFEPVRVIESRDPVDGAIYYQLFSPTDEAQFPSAQVRLLDGEAAMTPPPH